MFYNKAVYTAALVADGGQGQKTSNNSFVTDGRTDRRTDGRTDGQTDGRTDGPTKRGVEQCLAGPHGQGQPVPRHGRAGYRRSGARYGQGQYRGSVKGLGTR